jgi:hypothetical protein
MAEITEPGTVLGKQVAALAEGEVRAYLDGYRLAIEAFYHELNRFRQEDFGAERPAAVLIERARSALKGMTAEASNLARRTARYEPGIEVVETPKAGWGVRCNVCDDTTVGLDEAAAKALGRTHAADARHRALAAPSIPSESRSNP